MQGHTRGCQNEPPHLLFLAQGCGCHLQEPLVGQESPILPLQMGHSTLPGATWQGLGREDQSPTGLSPQPRAPAPQAPPPPSCRGLIQACGKWTRAGVEAVGTGGPRCLWDAVMLQMRLWAGLTNLLNCNSPWLRDLGPSQNLH